MDQLVKLRINAHVCVCMYPGIVINAYALCGAFCTCTDIQLGELAANRARPVAANGLVNQQCLRSWRLMLDNVRPTRQIIDKYRSSYLRKLEYEGGTSPRTRNCKRQTR